MDNLAPNSRGYLLWNESLGFAVSGKDAEVAVPVASLTKIMTALIALEQKELDEEVVITPEMLQGLAEFAVVGLQVGQKVTVEDLLYATMLPSAGDAAQALAVSVAGSAADFAEMMNARAAEIGMTNTHFSNAYGRDDDNYSTPADIAKLLNVALENEKFREIFQSFERELPSLGKTVRKTFAKNAFGEMNGAVLGGKTGFTNAAGRCLASEAEIEGTRYLLVTVGAEDGQHTADAAKVYQQVRDEYEPVKIVREGEVLVSVGVEQSVTKVVEIPAERDVTVALPNDIRQEDLQYEYVGDELITRETEVGSELGEYRILYDGQEIFAQTIVYDEPVEFYNYGWLALGVGVSVVLLAGALGVGWRMWRKKSRKNRHGKLLAVGLMIMFVVSALVNFGIFGRWLDLGGATEVHQPELTAGAVASEVTLEEAMEPTEERLTEKAEPENNQSAQQEQVLGNCTMSYGNLMLINPNFTVGTDFIAARKQQLISLSKTYGIPEYRAGNGDNLMIAEAAERLNAMVKAYQAANPGHGMGTRSCFRERGTTCGRLCAATGTSDHHTGLTCDLIDNAYGTELNTDEYSRHQEWQWLRENSYKYGFIDRFPEAWAGSAMSEPINVDGNGSTGLFETWHYRYVGVEAATEIATGKYNNGKYDSLEHYLKATGRVKDLKGGGC